MKWGIRDAGPEDLPALVEIERQCFSDRAWDASDFRSYRCAVAETEDGVIAGFAVWHEVYSGTDGAREREILNVAVAPPFRRLGVARALLKREIAAAGKYFLEVRESNTAARKLYEGLGFREAGRRPHYYRFPDETAIVMQMEQC